MGLVQFLIYSNVFSIVLVPLASVSMAGVHYYRVWKGSKKFSHKEKEIILYFIAFILSAVLSSIFSDHKKEAVPFTVGIFIILFGVYGYLVDRMYRWDIRKILRWYIDSSVFPAAIGILQIIFFNVKPLYGWAIKLDTNALLYKLVQMYDPELIKKMYHQWVDEGRIYSTFFNPNLYANYLIPIVILGIYYIFHEKRKRKKTFYIALTAINLFLLSETGSRAGFLGIFMGMLFYVVLRYSKKIIFVAIVCTAIFLAYVTRNPDLIPRYASMAFDFGDRINIWKAAYAYFVDHPLLGVGLTGFAKRFYIQYETGIMHAHNIYFGILAELGILGFMTFFGWLFKIVDYSKELIKDKNKTMMALWASFVGIFSQGILDFPIYNVQTILSFTFLLAVITSMIIKEENY